MDSPVLLVNPNSTVATTESMVRIAARDLPQVTGWTNPDAPPILTTPAALDAAALRVARLEPQADCAGVIVAAFGDPGCAALAARLEIPVVGIGASAARAAAGHGRFAVATTTPLLVASVDALMHANDPNGGFLGTFLTDPDLDLDAALIAASQRAIDSGAQAVIIGGGPLAEAAERIASALSVPLIAPVTVAARALRKLLDVA